MGERRGVPGAVAGVRGPIRPGATLRIPPRGATGALAATTGRAAEHPWVRVGPPPSGRDDPPPLVFVPGVNDALLSVADAPWFARLVAVYCRRYVPVGDGCRRAVYYCSRPRGVPSGAGTRDLAAGYADALAALPGDRADVVGISMGGFLATELAADHPDRVHRVVSLLAADRLHAAGRRRLRGWIEAAEAGNHGRIYREATDLLASGPTRLALRVGGAAYARLRGPPAPATADLRVSVRACLAHDGADRLPDVAAETLVLGGDRDPFCSAAAFRRTARALPRGRLALLGGVGHEAVIEHGRTVEGVVRRFLRDGDPRPPDRR